MHPHMITRLNRFDEFLGSPIRDVHLRPVAQQQATYISTRLQQIAIYDPVSHGRLFQGGRIEHENRWPPIRSLILRRPNEKVSIREAETQQDKDHNAS
jgi:hypothetical protein